MQKVRFIHTADIHLGSFLSIAGTSLPGHIEKHIAQANLESFRRICELAIKEEVDFLLLAGDLYDREARSVRAQEFFNEQARLLEAAHINIYLLAGNHDPLREKNNLFAPPANVKVFAGEEAEVFTALAKDNLPLARLIGQSYQTRAENKKIHLKYPPMDQSLWNIALLHTQLEAGRSNYIPCTLSELKERTDIHYWALGHIHKRELLNNEYPFIAYPGIPQGRHFGEEGRGGCYLVELGGREKESIKFVPLAPLAYKRLKVNLTKAGEEALESFADLSQRLIEIGQEVLSREEDSLFPFEGYLVDWQVKGRLELAELDESNREEFLEELKGGLRRHFKDGQPFLWTSALSLHLEPPLDYQEYFASSPLLAELDKLLTLYEGDEELRDKLQKKLGRVWEGHPNFEEHSPNDDFRFHLSQDKLKDFLDLARIRILERLVEKGPCQ